ncbi:enoyl-CoA hydratase/isomerase [Gracilibacillus dipsosauri]|uniref:Enoyl-CoA hydratase n=1 Tax=Gracilibacillus dipsosauri TaxID=178340 RepID=A0A317KVN2_9BACI|nr:enoyl-CoA hydratase/isomerase [Gracilibacillus dipsosauri]PWU67353.1 enoyl-CoA hydratase [Gracilibacillus dipsosauri]
MDYQTVNVQIEQAICYLQLYRPKANNTINDQMIEECHHVLDCYEKSINVVVIEGLPDVFCFGADFQELHDTMASGQIRERNPERLYDLWLRLATGPFITISHVRGRVNAGGIGFVAASDIVLAESNAQFSLSELLFGVFPAAVLPFLIRRIGVAKANYLTIMTKTFTVQQADAWGLVDAFEDNSKSLLRKHLLRLKPLTKTAITRYKQYVHKLYSPLQEQKSLAVEANQEMFSDEQNLAGIYRYIETGKFPWE